MFYLVEGDAGPGAMHGPSLQYCCLNTGDQILLHDPDMDATEP